MSNIAYYAVSITLYLIVIIGVSIWYTKRSNSSSDNYFLGGRSLGPWVAALSAEASDMSGWLLMGLPGVAFWCGFAEAGWTAIGLLLGTYINWRIVAKPLHNYSVKTESITIPEFFSNRYKEQNTRPLLIMTSLIILIFFSVYAASCFVTTGKLFSTVFSVDYKIAMIIGAAFVIIYTYLGGFLAESISDLIQAFIMIIALIIVLGGGILAAGGVGHVFSNLENFPGFLDFFTTASPVIDESTGKQVVKNSVPLFGEAGKYGLFTIISTLSWGLGYFGMPQVLLRFFAIRSAKEIKRSRIIATVWCTVSLIAAVMIGIVGRAIYASEGSLISASSAETVFTFVSQTLFHPVVAGLMMAGILAAVMSSADSYMLIAASAFAKNIFQGVISKKSQDNTVLFVSKIALLIVSIVGVIIALNENSVIFRVVSFAWAGFGASFGPLVLFSLFWKRTNAVGALAGVVTGGAVVFIWKLILNPQLGGFFTIYELFPAFILSCIAIIAVSLSTKKPSKEILDEFDAVKAMN